jgi:hypothetical protein
LDNIKFEFTESDALEIAAELERVREAHEGEEK